MNPAKEFNEANSIMKAPKSMPQCMDLEVWKGNQQDKTPVIISKWTPDENEIELLKNGGSVYLYIIGSQMPPVSLTVINPFYDLNNPPEIYKQDSNNN